MKRLALAFVAALALTLTPANAGEFQKGMEAYENGDYAAALTKWMPLATAGDAIAQYSLGVMNESGQGVPQNDAEAARWYRLAAEQGIADAQFNLANMYNNGKGVLQDYAEALRLFRLAADQGYADAQNNLALMYDNGEGVPQDYAAAVRWYNLAAKQGNVLAQNNLALMYLNGDGVLQNFLLGHMWANISAANGYKPGATLRDSLAAKMSRADVSTAQKMARECLASDYKNCGN